MSITDGAAGAVTGCSVGRHEPVSLGNRYQEHMDVSMKRIRALVARGLVKEFGEKAHREVGRDLIKDPATADKHPRPFWLRVPYVLPF